MDDWMVELRRGSSDRAWDRFLPTIAARSSPRLTTTPVTRIASELPRPVCA